MDGVLLMLLNALAIVWLVILVSSSIVVLVALYCWIHSLIVEMLEERRIEKNSPFR